ncbi:MAG: hypothetical protein GY705_23265 [Bacteroidetes bacterium]|nr:hypothetical protein [Bacteroidota bacterium]
MVNIHTFFSGILSVLFVFGFSSVYAGQWQTIVGSDENSGQQLMGEPVATIDSEEQPGQTSVKKPMTIIFVKGHNAVSLFNQKDSSFEKEMREAFKGHNVEFFRDSMTKSKVTNAILKADVFYINAHQLQTPYNGLAALQVAPSDDNQQISQGGNSLITSLDIKKALAGKKAPSLVIFNTCKTTDPAIGVPPRSQFNAAFSTDEQTKGKVFLGWRYKVIGNHKDAVFKTLLSKWAEPDEKGRYPEFGKVFNDPNVWGNSKKATLYGDAALKFAKDLDQNTLVGTWDITGSSKGRASTTGTISFLEDSAFKVVFHVVYKNGRKHTTPGSGTWLLNDTQLNMKYKAGAVYNGTVKGNSLMFSMSSGNGWRLSFKKLNTQSEADDELAGFDTSQGYTDLFELKTEELLPTQPAPF